MTITEFVTVLRGPRGDEVVLGLLPNAGPSPDSLLNFGQRPEARRLARERFRAVGSSRDRSEAVRQAIVDSDVPAQRREFALWLVPTQAREIAPIHRRAILNRCLKFGAAAIDPYVPASSSGASRWAAVSLLVADPALDNVMLDEVTAGNLDRNTLLLIVAGALVQRDGSWRAFVATIDAAQLEPEAALEFAVRCDRRSSTLDVIEFSRSRYVRGRRAVQNRWHRVRDGHLWGRPLLGALLALAYSGVVLLIGAGTAHLPAGYPVDPGAALAALSLLVTAVVFATELAADRLHGLIARRVAVSPALAAAFTFSVLLLLAASWRVGRTAMDKRAFIQAGLLAGMVWSLTLALVGLLRRTDALQAAEQYARRRRRVFVKAGHQFGRVQQAAIAVHTEISGFGWAKLSISRAHSERRVPIAAERRGFVLADLSALSSMDQEDVWRSQELRLRVTAPLGSIVAPDDEIATIVPDVGAVVEWCHVARAGKAVTARPISAAFSEALEAVGALVGVITRLAASGNVEAARRAADRLSALVIVSLEAARQTRGESRSPLVPHLPLAVVATDQAVAALKSSSDAAIHRTMTELLQRLAGLGQEDEGLASVVATRFTVGFKADHDIGLQINVLWIVACRAVDANDSVAVGQIFARLDDLTALSDSSLRTPGRAVDLAGWIGMYETWSRPRWADDTYVWIANHSKDSAAQRAALHRLGAASLLAGNQSLAAKIAFGFKGAGPALRSYAEDRGNAQREQGLNQLYGLVLGDEPQWALLEFAEFVDALTDSVSRGG